MWYNKERKGYVTFGHEILCRIKNVMLDEKKVKEKWDREGRKGPFDRNDDMKKGKICMWLRKVGVPAFLFPYGK